MDRIRLPLLLGLLAGLLAIQPAEAQILDRLKEGAQRGAERAAEREAARRADRAVTAAFGLAEDAVVCAVTDETCIAEAQAEGNDVLVVDANGDPLPASRQPSVQATQAGRTATAGGTSPMTPDEGVWANYDFVPGERVLYYHDFEGTRTGNFPSRLDYIAGNLDVVELGSGEAANKVLRVGEGTSESEPGGSGCFTIPLPETLPERYTIEYRVRTSDPLHRATTYLFSDGSDDTPDPRCTYPPNPHVYVASNGSGLQLPGGYGAPKSGVDQVLPTDAWVNIAISVDGPYWKMYMDGERIANVPRFEFPRADKLHVFMNVYRHSVFLDDLRIAEGGPRSLYDDLEADGFIATTAIRFDTGQATIKPESSGILNEVLAMMEEVGDLRLRVEGHTDSVGSDASNQTLSERRAEAVAAWLVRHGIDEGRLETAGRGESAPRADNGSDEGRAENRRVEFHRL